MTARATFNRFTGVHSHKSPQYMAFTGPVPAPFSLLCQLAFVFESLALVKSTDREDGCTRSAAAPASTDELWGPCPIRRLVQRHRARPGWRRPSLLLVLWIANPPGSHNLLDYSIEYSMSCSPIQIPEMPWASISSFSLFEISTLWLLGIRRRSTSRVNTIDCGTILR